MKKEVQNVDVMTHEAIGIIIFVLRFQSIKVKIRQPSELVARYTVCLV